jgi:hypothetical protein
MAPGMAVLGRWYRMSWVQYWVPEHTNNGATPEDILPVGQDDFDLSIKRQSFSIIWLKAFDTVPQYHLAPILLSYHPIKNVQIINTDWASTDVGFHSDNRKDAIVIRENQYKWILVKIWVLRSILRLFVLNFLQVVHQRDLAQFTEFIH